MTRLKTILQSAIDGFFYGKITICFQNGKITHIIKEETIKL
jgi:hypothetical protein